jgi:tetratricopeptide (TPR) repeat protein
MTPNNAIKQYLLFLPILVMLLMFSGDALKRAPIDHSDPANNRRMGYHHYNEGNKALKAGQWDKAVDNYKMALHHNPDSAETLVNLSTTYLRMELYDSAHDTLKQLAEKSPSNPLLFYNLACYYSLTRQAESSLAALQQAVTAGYKNKKEIQTDPDLANVRNFAGFEAWFRTMD